MASARAFPQAGQAPSSATGTPSVGVAFVFEPGGAATGAAPSGPGIRMWFSANERGRLAAVIGIAAVLAYAAVLHPLFRASAYGGPDLTQQDYPSRAFYAAGLRQGELRLWSPHLFRGFSLHGEGQTGICHPLHLLLYSLLPFALAAFLDTVLAFPLAFAGAWFLFRHWGSGRTGALFGAGVFTFSSFFFSHTGHVALLLVHAHLPWMLLFADLLITSERRRELSFAGLAAATGSAALFGHPPTLWANVFAVILFGLVCAWRAPGRRLERLASLAVCLVLGALLGAIQLLPTLDSVRQSGRGALSSEMRCNFSLHPLNLWQFFSPRVFPELTVGNWHFGDTGSAPMFGNSVAEFAVYPGVLLMVFTLGCVCSFPRRFLAPERRTRILALAWIGVIGFFLMLGRNGGLFLLLGYLPVVREFRCSARYISFVHLALAGLSATGVGLLVRDRECRLLPRVLLATAGVFVGAGLTAMVVGRFVQDSRFAFSAWPRQLAGPLLALAAAGLLAPRNRPLLRLGVFAGAVFVDLLSFGMHILGPTDQIPLAELSDLYAAYRQPPGINREYRLDAPKNSGIWKAYCLAGGYMGLPPDDPLAPVCSPREWRLLTSTARYWEREKWHDVADPLPRFRFVPEVVYDTPGERLGDVSVRATLSDPSLPLPELAPGAARVQVVTDRPHRIVLEAESETAQLLVCSDRYDPDWTVRINGRQAPLLPLHNWGLRGIVVPPGHSEIVMQYRPGAFRAGLRITLSAALLLTGIAFTGWIRGRAAGADPQGPGSAQDHEPEQVQSG